MKRYQGEWDTLGAAVVTVYEDGKKPYPLEHVVRHSPTGFAWGYSGSGPAELARCILIDFYGREHIDNIGMIYQDFKRDVIAGIPERQNIFVLTEDQIHQWSRKNHVLTLVNTHKAEATQMMAAERYKSNMAKENQTAQSLPGTERCELSGLKP